MRKLSYIKFHDVSYLPGIGQLPAILPSQTKNIKGLTMWDTGGVELVIECVNDKNKVVRAGIPKAAAQLYVYEGDEAPASSAAKVA